MSSSITPRHGTATPVQRYRRKDVRNKRDPTPATNIANAGLCVVELMMKNQLTADATFRPCTCNPGTTFLRHARFRYTHAGRVRLDTR